MCEALPPTLTIIIIIIVIIIIIIIIISIIIMIMSIIAIIILIVFIAIVIPSQFEHSGRQILSCCSGYCSLTLLFSFMFVISNFK